MYSLNAPVYSVFLFGSSVNMDNAFSLLVMPMSNTQLSVPSEANIAIIRFEPNGCRHYFSSSNSDFTPTKCTVVAVELENQNFHLALLHPN